MSLTAELASRGFVFVLGLILFSSTTLSLMRTVIVPRPLRSTFTDIVYWIIRGSAQGVAGLRRDYAWRDAVLAWVGPLLILGSLLAWMLGYLVAYGFMLYGTGAGGLGDSLRQSGSSLLTLGFAASRLEDQTILDLMAAATGPLVIGMLIGFLPTIYQTYLEREEAVTMLSAQAGEPAWGVELLSRTALTGSLHELPDLFRTWERWAATLRLTLTTYPVLIYVRSPRRRRHFAVSLLAVLDAASLCSALNPDLVGREASQLVLQGSQTFDVLFLERVAKRTKRSLIPVIGRFIAPRTQPDPQHITVPNPDPAILAVHAAAAHDAAASMSMDGVAELDAGERSGSTLTRQEFDDAVETLRASGFPVSIATDDAWQMLTALRSRYEYPAFGVMRALDAVRAPWSGDRRIDTPVVFPTSALGLIPPK